MGDEGSMALPSGSVEAAVKAMLAENGASAYENLIEVVVVITAAVNSSRNSLFFSFLLYSLLMVPCRSHGDGGTTISFGMKLFSPSLVFLVAPLKRLNAKPARSLLKRQPHCVSLALCSTRFFKRFGNPT